MHIPQSMVGFDLSVVTDGIRKFVRLTGLASEHNPNKFDAKWVRDEFDLVDAVSTIKYFMKHTNRMIGAQKHPKTPFDHIDDVSKDLHELLLVPKDQTSASALPLLRKKNLVMYHLVVIPVVKAMEQFNGHRECIQRVDEYIDYVCDELIMNSGVETTYEDAIVAKHQIAKMIEERETIRKSTTKVRKKRKLVVEEEPPIEED